MSPTFRRPVSRRRFLSRSLSGAAALGTFAAPTIRTTLASANERIGVAVIGFNGMGRGHIKRLAAMQNQAQIVRLCDLDPEVRARGAAILKEVSGETAPLCSEYERVLEDKSVDAVVIATPHHWHAPMAMAAFAAGKAAYIEKPISHVYAEGTRIIDGRGKELPEGVAPRVQMPWHPSYLKEVLVVMLRRNVGHGRILEGFEVRWGLVVRVLQALTRLGPWRD